LYEGRVWQHTDHISENFAHWSKPRQQCSQREVMAICAISCSVGEMLMHTVHLAVMLISVEHDGGISQDVDHIRILEEVRALHVVACAKALHDPVDLLGLAR